ncbi:hypothetical protein ABIC24_001242 [Methylobacterium radiotolerans]
MVRRQEPAGEERRLMVVDLVGLCMGCGCSHGFGCLVDLMGSGRSAGAQRASATLVPVSMRAYLVFASFSQSA